MEEINEVKEVSTKPRLNIAERRARVVDMLSQGMSAKDIMAELGVSSTYVYKVYKVARVIKLDMAKTE